MRTETGYRQDIYLKNQNTKRKLGEIVVAYFRDRKAQKLVNNNLEYIPAEGDKVQAWHSHENCGAVPCPDVTGIICHRPYFSSSGKNIEVDIIQDSTNIAKSINLLYMDVTGNFTGTGWIIERLSDNEELITLPNQRTASSEVN